MSVAQSIVLPGVFTMATRPNPASYQSAVIRVSDVPNCGFGLQYSVGTAWFNLARVQSDQLTTAANGTVTWTFPIPYPVGTVPKCQAIVITASGNTENWNVQQDGAATNTQVSFRVKRQSVVTLLAVDVTVPVAVPGATTISVQAVIP